MSNVQRIYLFQVFAINMDQNVTISGNDKISVLQAENLEEAVTIMDHTIYSPEFKNGDWFMIVDAHEIISFPSSPEFTLTIRDALLRIDNEPFGMNAVGLTYFFMPDSGYDNFPDNIPFQIYGPGVWNDGKYRDLNIQVNTMSNRVKIWKKSSYLLNVVVQTTVEGYSVITDVMFTGRHVYPYFMQSLRHHPKHTERPIEMLSPSLHTMYAYEAILGFMSIFRQPLMQTRILY